ncbi:hypothetical protein BLGI_1089 [Brevibacillus laterosporus GI-9]|nr:hypothetical protein BLGI_1089 [Brevibacillus laterosporus GI-9]
MLSFHDTEKHLYLHYFSYHFFLPFQLMRQIRDFIYNYTQKREF